VESKERFPHSHSHDDGCVEYKILKQKQNRETPVISALLSGYKLHRISWLENSSPSNLDLVA
jgi:hypothetical protein